MTVSSDGGSIQPDRNITAIQNRGWPISPSKVTPFLWEFGYRNGRSAIVYICVHGPLDTINRISAVLQTSIATTPFQLWTGGSRLTLGFRFSGSPRRNETWRTKEGHAVDILWGGKPIEFTTGTDDTKWLRHPSTFSDFELPELDDASITKALDAVSRISPIDVMSDITVDSDDPGRARGWLTPTNRLAVRWSVDMQGHVTHGHLAWSTAVGRHWAVLSRGKHTDEARSQAILNALAYVGDKARADQTIVAAMKDAVTRSYEAAALSMSSFMSRGRPANFARIEIEPCRTEPGWVSDICGDENRYPVLSSPQEGEDTCTSAGIAVGEDLTAPDRLMSARSKLSSLVETAISDFLMDVQHEMSSIRLLNIPTGIGKTTKITSELISKHRTMIGSPQIGFSSPTYENLGEIKARIEAADIEGKWLPLPDDELALALASPDRLRFMLFAGRIHAGCLIPEKMRLAMVIGQGASLCLATGSDGDEVRCPHYDVCPSIAQRRQVRHANIVFFPHQFLAVAKPPELDSLRGVIIDERTDHLFLRTASAPVDEITAPRRRVPMTKAMKAAGITPEKLASDRNAAWEMILTALRANIDPATQVAQKLTLLDLCRSALWLCEAVQQRDIQVTPNTPLETLQEAADRPSGRWIEEEEQIWRALIEDAGSLQTTGQRVRFATEGVGKEVISISWRVTPNWSDRPILALDASGSAEIAAKIWKTDRIFDGGEEPSPGKVLHEYRDVEAEITVNASLPTVFIQEARSSKSSFLYDGVARQNPQGEIDAAIAVHGARRMITSIAGRNAGGRVLVGGMKKVLTTITRDWMPPSNVDFAHFGALRGLNRFERHCAAISIGRMEIPPPVAKGLAIALSHDDPSDSATDMMEAPDSASSVLVLRDGRTVTIPSPIEGGRWERLIQNSSREEELRQFAGRLRAVQRGTAAGNGLSWSIIGNVLPARSVVDAVITSEDILADPLFPIFEAIRRNLGLFVASKLRSTVPDLIVGRDTDTMIKQFLKADTTKANWRLTPQHPFGTSDVVLAPRHMGVSDTSRRLTLIKTALPWAERVFSGAASLEMSETAGWAEWDAELANLSIVMRDAGFNPDSGTSLLSDTEEFPVSVPWPGLDGMQSTIGVVSAGYAIRAVLDERP